ncbi:MAG TPA: Uma2 family endonuclease [Puia sp.]|nr:Uma2 family endonuclease [Puia sp.]
MEKEPTSYDNEAGQGESFVREPVEAYGRKKLSIAEFLEWESAQTERHEYYQGEIFVMMGPKLPHARITGNMSFELMSRLKGGGCQVFSTDLRLHIPSNTLFTYPDISVVCGEPETLNNDDWNLLNPCMLIEVLSPSTRTYDRGIKFGLYKDIPSLREYVLIDSEKIKAETWLRHEDHWDQQVFEDPDGVLDVRSLGLSIPLRDIYTGTKLL